MELDRAIAEHRTLIAEGVRRRGRERRSDDSHDPAGEIRAGRLRPGARARLRFEAGAQSAHRDGLARARRELQPA